MVECKTINVKLSNLQLSKLKTAIKNNDRTTLRLNIKNFNKSGLPHDLILTRGQIKKRNK